MSRGPLSNGGLSQTEERRELQGTAALIMLLPALPFSDAGGDERDVPLLSALLQLKQLQQASAWHCPPPLVVLVPGPDRGSRNTQKLEEGTTESHLLSNGVCGGNFFFFKKSHLFVFLGGLAELMLPLLVKDGLIAEYTLLFIPETTNDMQGTKQVKLESTLKTWPKRSLARLFLNSCSLSL